MLDWLIVGGGIHGVHLAARLMGDAEVSAEKLRILDPHPALLARWKACTATTGMKHLRSPAVHHLDSPPFALQRFAGRRKRARRELFAAPYDRPALSLFNAHCDDVIQRWGLHHRHVFGRAERIHLEADAVTVESGADRLQARQVVLALGSSEQLHWPSWAPQGAPRVQHVFEPGFALFDDALERHVLIVGGGITAAQVALRLTGEGRRVTLLCRHPLRVHQFDSDPGWLGPKSFVEFTKEGSPDRRRAMIQAARHRGSVPPDVERGLRRAMQGGLLERLEGEVLACEPSASGVALHTSCGALAVDRVLLATGFESKRPGGAVLDALVKAAALPCARCGYPIVDRQLRWRPRLFVTGPLAELELGPVARNIAGARRAGDRIVGEARAPTPAKGSRRRVVRASSTAP
jgi:cation diffusion facilitator CzcD-associated flavoprotein CzcO